MGSSLPQRWLCGQLLFCLLEGSSGSPGQPTQYPREGRLLAAAETADKAVDNAADDTYLEIPGSYKSFFMPGLSLGSFGNQGSLFMEIIGNGNGPGVNNNDKIAFCLLPWNV